MNLEFDDDQRHFVEDVRALLQGLPHDGYFRDHTEGEIGAIRQVHRALGAKGWLSLSWPAWAGGSELPAVYEFLLWDEMAYARAARPPLASGIVAKTIIAHGTEDQHERYLPGIRAGELAFSLGYSEPEAGSDLAGLRTRAVRHGDCYVVTGEKRWTSGAHWADHLWLLCRTGSQDSRGRGLTLLIVDMTSPGITVNRLPTVDGGTLNEVFLNDVEVPVIDRVGEENGAWPLIVESLAVERHVQFSPGRLRRDLDDIVAWVRSSGRAADPTARAMVATLAATVAQAEAMALVVLDAVISGRPSVGVAAANKLINAAACQELARAAADLCATDSLVRGSAIEELWRQSILETIGGGTTEVMASVVARELLHLGSSR